MIEKSECDDDNTSSLFASSIHTNACVWLFFFGKWSRITLTIAFTMHPCLSIIQWSVFVARPCQTIRVHNILYSRWYFWGDCAYIHSIRNLLKILAFFSSAVCDSASFPLKRIAILLWVSLFQHQYHNHWHTEPLSRNTDEMKWDERYDTSHMWISKSTKCEGKKFKLKVENQFVLHKHM